MNSPDTLSTRSSCVPIATTVRLVHPEHREQLPGNEEEAAPMNAAPATPMRAATCTASVGAVRAAPRRGSVRRPRPRRP